MFRIRVHFFAIDGAVMHNLKADREACVASGVREDDFYYAIMSFEGTSKRLQRY